MKIKALSSLTKAVREQTTVKKTATPGNKIFQQFLIKWLGCQQSFYLFDSLPCSEYSVKAVTINFSQRILQYG